eukprot:TRINITY_DN6633_c0_g2_i1.p1 TRINITY_DN6633_c0_g2~~TRINITY_DN6633_c0_g2_i1.p1  ORF type:complete len:955 (+),score=486.66 TRINITY_DN6633_c0_g2_i1:60-2924(+)
MSLEGACSLLVGLDKQPPSQKELKVMLEKGDTQTKIQAVKDMIALTLNGEPQTAMIMSVIKFIQPAGTTTSSNEKQDNDVRTLKKLALYFWEVLDKRDSQGKLLPELILLVDFLRRDLSHPNEFVRGATLRFLCNLKEKEILEPLATTVLDCLSHRHSYVRRNAVMAISNIYERAPEALPQAPEAVEQLLAQESDVNSKRNAFIMLFKSAPDCAVAYLRTVVDSGELSSQNDVFQLAVVELLQKLIKTNPREKSQYIKVIFTLLQSKSQSVLFQCAATLLSLSSSPTAIKASATTLVNLLNTQSDNNVKLVVVGKLEDIEKRYPEALHGLTMDMLRCLVGSEVEIQKRILDLTLDLVTSKNVEKVLAFLKKELIETSNQAATAATNTKSSGDADYRQLLIKFVHQTTVRHNHVAPLIVPTLMDLIVEDSRPAVDTILFIREMMFRSDVAGLREDVIEKLALQFGSIKGSRVFRIALWILGTQAKTYEEVKNVMTALRSALEPFPLWMKDTSDDAEEETTVGGGAVVQADGTYAQSMVMDKPKEDLASNSFRALITEGDFFLAAVLGNTLVKLVSTAFALSVSNASKEGVQKNALSLMAELLQLGVAKSIDADSHERLRVCQKLVQHVHNPLLAKYTANALKGFGEMVAEEDELAAAEKDEGKKGDEPKFVPVDQPIMFSQLVRTRKGAGEMDGFFDLEDVTTATKNDTLASGNKLQNVLQLTGFSDPVYVEGTVEVHQFDILLEFLVVSRTQDTLQNLTIELGTHGDLRLCERPQVYTLAPGEEITIKANMKVSSMEVGIIFGNLVFDSSKPGAADQTVIVLNDLHMDIIDYVHPASCNATAFRTMWQDFEWENKLTVATEIKSLREYLDHILKHTNMRCQAMSTSIAGEADFLSANLLAKSSFGEPVVANISISKQLNGGIEGYIRIRSRSQGIALGLGDKITMKQKDGSEKK